MTATRKSYVKPIVLLLFALAALFLSGCAVAGKVPESDSGYAYAQGAAIPTDSKVYHITGVVEAEPEDLTRQTEPGRGYVSGYGSGFITGTYYGPEYAGKGFVRLRVTASDSDLAPVGALVLLKTTDTKIVLLIPGDQATFVCRAQAEAVAAMYVNEPFDPVHSVTWELDYCRLPTSVIESGPR